MDDPQQIMTSPAEEHPESPWWRIVLLAGLALLVIDGLVMNWPSASANDPYMAAQLKLWLEFIGIICIVAIFSLLYKENPLFRFFEHIFIGLSAGYIIAITWVQILEPQWYKPMLPTDLGGEGKWTLIFIMLVATLFFTVYFPKLSWMNRLLMLGILGYYSGMALKFFLGGTAPQITAAFRPPITTYQPTGLPTGPPGSQTGHWPIGTVAGHPIFFHPWWLVSLVVLLCVFAYFFFSIDHKRAWVRRPSVLGRYFIMIMLGVIFGTTVMARFALLIARLDFLKEACLHWWSALVK